MTAASAVLQEVRLQELGARSKVQVLARIQNIHTLRCRTSIYPGKSCSGVTSGNIFCPHRQRQSCLSFYYSATSTHTSVIKLGEAVTRGSVSIGDSELRTFHFRATQCVWQRTPMPSTSRGRSEDPAMKSMAAP